MANERPHSFLGPFSPTAFYASPAAAGFNPTAGIMWAAALIYPTGAWLDAGSFDNHIWGNLSGNTGWALRIVNNGATIDITASYGTGAAVVDAEYNIASGANSQLGIAERLMLVGMILDVTGGVSLVINGQVVATTAGAAYAPSAAAVRMGVTPAGDNEAGLLFINSVAYRNNAPLGGNSIGGTMFYLAREGRELGFMIDQGGAQSDWDHLYLASDGGNEVPAITPDGDTFSFAGTLEAATSLPDRGNRGVTPQAGVTPIALQRTGSAVAGPFLVQIANPDYYAGAGALALVPPPP